METKKAIEALETEGFKVHFITPCQNGVSHHNFDVMLSENSSSEPQRRVARFESDLGRSDGRRVDLIYGGKMSLEREAALCSLVREKAGLPAPKTTGPYTKAESFILAEHMPGQLWGEYLQQQNYSCQAFLNSLRLLGEDVGKAHSVTFDAFGDLMGTYVDNGVSNFSTRLEQVIQRNLQNNGDKFSEPERMRAEKYFASTLQKIEKATKKDKPRFIFADLHPNNLMVYSDGKPSAYFDLEFCQTGVPALEIYNVSLQFFALFNLELFSEAQNAFLKGYRASGLDYEPEDPKNKQVELVLAANHFFRAAASYQKFTEGSRAGWAAKFKDIFFDIVDNDIIDYIGFKKTVRPQFPNQPSLP